MATFIVSQLALPAFDSVSTTAIVPKGTTVWLTDGGTATYCQALSGVVQYAGVVIGVDYTCSALTTADVADDSGIGKQVGWSQVSCASASYCWIQTSGRPKGKLAANCGDRVSLFTTGTSGVIDDATISAALIAGVVSKTTISNATAITLMVPSRAFIFPFANPA